jgi:hypothetical protein
MGMKFQSQNTTKKMKWDAEFPRLRVTGSTGQAPFGGNVASLQFWMKPQSIRRTNLFNRRAKSIRISCRSCEPDSSASKKSAHSF